MIILQLRYCHLVGFMIVKLMSESQTQKINELREIMINNCSEERYRALESLKDHIRLN